MSGGVAQATLYTCLKRSEKFNADIENYYLREMWMNDSNIARDFLLCQRRFDVFLEGMLLAVTFVDKILVKSHISKCLKKEPVIT